MQAQEGEVRHLSLSTGPTELRAAYCRAKCAPHPSKIRQQDKAPTRMADAHEVEDEGDKKPWFPQFETFLLKADAEVVGQADDDTFLAMFFESLTFDPENAITVWYADEVAPLDIQNDLLYFSTHSSKT